MACFTILYGFISSLLHLEGFSKLIYAVIFNFWVKSRRPVTVPYSVIRNITGATDPTISACIKNLTDKGLISSDPKPGKRTKYTIILNEEIWLAYLKDSNQSETSKVSEELSSVKDTPKVFRDTTKLALGHKQHKRIQRKDSLPVTNLDISSANRVSTRIKTIKIKHTS